MSRQNLSGKPVLETEILLTAGHHADTCFTFGPNFPDSPRPSVRTNFFTVQVLEWITIIHYASRPLFVFKINNDDGM